MTESKPTSQHDFDANFECLTGHERFPWQRALFEEFIRDQELRKTLSIPTGLGKTAVIAIWLLALAHRFRIDSAGGFARRLVYVVNRRTVVDQATREAERLREALQTKPQLRPVAEALRSLGLQASDAPLAISTLRGQFADNAEWRDDPARPAVVVGTVDMIGSRLLFSGYGCGFKTRPLHAGFLGQDVLLIHDEAHLEPAFQRLITAIEEEQQRCRGNEPQADFRGFRVMAMSATSRDGDGTPDLTGADREHQKVKERFEAKKRLVFEPVEDERNVEAEVTKLARRHQSSGSAILIFLRKVEDVERVAEKLRRIGPVQTLTGTMRGLERDDLVRRDEVFARFMRESKVTPTPGTVYLVCTSAGEVGIDISADHLVCDLTPFDSMAQRLGRVNRFGDGDARVDVVHPKKAAKKSPLAERCQRTLELLRKLPATGGEDRRLDASPAALSSLPIEDRRAAFTPEPVIVGTSDILFDALALTSVRETLPGRPVVAEWLHGIAEWDLPETHVAWREEVEILTGNVLAQLKAEDLLEDYPLKPHELLRDRWDRVFDHLKKRADDQPDAPVWIVTAGGSVEVATLSGLVHAGNDVLRWATIVLPPNAGGLRIGEDGRSSGMLDGTAGFQEAHRSKYDVADDLRNQDGNQRRARVWDDDDPPEGMRLVRAIDLEPDNGEEGPESTDASRRSWRWYVRPHSADDDGSRTALKTQELKPHLRSARDFGAALAAKLALSKPEATAVTVAAGWHDLGKDREIWQRSIGNRDPHVVLAKSGGRMRPLELNGYRHEFGSLIDVRDLSEFYDLPPDVQDLVLHLIAAHHGRARPHFPTDEAFDPRTREDTAAAVAGDVPRRFARLQRKYGRWGLAYLESLVRAADILASQSGGSGGSASPGVAATPPPMSTR